MQKLISEMKAIEGTKAFPGVGVEVKLRGAVTAGAECAMSHLDIDIVGWRESNCVSKTGSKGHGGGFGEIVMQLDVCEVGTRGKVSDPQRASAHA